MKNQKKGLRNSMKIIVKNEKEKAELLRTCQYLHDFSVMFNKRYRKQKITIVRSFDNSIPSEQINERNVCGISLDLDMFPLLNFLVALYDAEGDIKDEIIKETIIVQDHTNKFQIEG